jgi:hypothetical protein
MLSFDPQENIGNMADVQRAAFVEGAVELLREYEPSETEAVLMLEEPRKVDEEKVEGMGEKRFEMGYTFVENRESTELRLREIVLDSEKVVRVADYEPESDIPEGPFFPRRIFDFEGTEIHEWPTPGTSSL